LAFQQVFNFLLFFCLKMEVGKYLCLLFFVSACIIHEYCRAGAIEQFNRGTVYFALNTETGFLNISGVGAVIPEVDNYGHCFRVYPENWTTLIKTVKIGDSITDIWNNAFEGCTALTSIEIPSSVTWIHPNSFNDCSNLHYNEYDNAKYLGNRDNAYHVLMSPMNQSITSCEINCNTRVIAQFAFQYCTELKSIEFPNSLTTIGGYAFQECKGLTSIVIPDSVTSLGDRVFRLCSGLTSVTIGNSVTSIGGYSFWACSALTSVTIGNSVTSIDEYAFSECGELTSVTIGNSIKIIGVNAFGGCSKIAYNEYDNAQYLGNDDNAFVALIKAKNTV